MASFFKTLVAGAAMTIVSLQGVQQAHAITHPGMAQFCNNYSSQCRVDTTRQVTMTSELMTVLEQVNSRVNRSIRASYDRPGRDTWSLNPRSGDCEDFALSKRAALISQGVPAGVLRIAITKTRRGEPHAVLVVRTSSGDLVLDNLRSRVTTLAQSGYRLQFMSGADPRQFSRAG
jgi:predicted transglutaminase-like cysteine proteinase